MRGEPKREMGLSDQCQEEMEVDRKDGRLCGQLAGLGSEDHFSAAVHEEWGICVRLYEVLTSKTLN